MDKKTLLALVLIGIILFGFTWYQTKQENERNSAAQKEMMEQALRDQAMDSLHKMQADSSAAPATLQEKVSDAGGVQPSFSEGAMRYADTCLRKAYSEPGVYPDSIVVIQNSKLKLALASKGAQLFSANVLDYKAYGQDSLLLIRPGSSDYDLCLSLESGNINTRDFDFAVEESNDSCAVFRLYFEKGGYLQQKYVLPQDSYMVHNTLEFHDVKGVISSNTRKFTMNWTLDIPRLEKGFKNEKQYSKLDVLCMDEDDPEVIGNGSDESESYRSSISWFDFNQQFFSVIMTAREGFASGDFDVKFAEESDPDGRLMTCRAQNVRVNLDAKEGQAEYGYDFYIGPNAYHTLSSYERNYEKVITIGGKVIGLITRFLFIPTFNFLSRFISNFGIIILIMTVILKLLLSPLTSKSYMSSAKMNALKPEIDKLNEKYPKANEDKQQALKKQQATMDLYKRAGVKPLGGCLPMLLQLPILWAMFRFFPASIELRQQPFLWADDLSAYDSILDFPTSVLGMDHLSLFALLMALSMFFYSKITMPKSNDPQMKPMRFMSVWLMPIMMFFICNGLSSALSYYYLLSNIFTMIQTFIIKKWVVKPEKILATLEANRNKPMPKSKWQLRLEAAQKAAQEQQRNAGRR